MDEQVEIAAPPSAHHPNNQVNGLLAALEDRGANRIAELREACVAFVAERKRVGMDLLNEERKRQRLRSKTNNFNNKDLLAILGCCSAVRFSLL